MPASARTCWTPRTSRRRRGTPAAPERRRAGSAASAPNREVWQRGRQRGDRRDRQDGGARPGLLPSESNRAGRSMRTTVCRSARHSTPPPAHSKASTRPDSATVSAVKPRRTGSPGNLGLERAWKPHVHPGSGAPERPGRPETGTWPWRQPDSRNRPSAERTDRPLAGPACGPTPPTARPRSWSGALRVLRAGQAARQPRPRSPLLRRSPLHMASSSLK